MYQQIRLGAGGSLTFDPPQAGRATSATYILYQPDGTTVVAASANATNDAVSTTLSALAAVDATTLSLTSATGVTIGRRYLLTDSTDAQSEWVRVVAITAAGAATLAEPLQHAYTNGSAFVGNRITCTVSAGSATPQDEGYEARITYAIAGTTYVASVYYDVVRQPWPDVILRADEFATYAGSLSARVLQRINSTGLGFVDEIATATILVREELLDRGTRPDLFRTFDGFKRSVALRVLLEWAEEGTNIPSAWQDQPDAWIDQARQRYQQAITRALNTVRTFDSDDDVTITAADREVRRGSVLITR